VGTKYRVYRNVAGLNKALRRLPKEASARLRDASVDIAEMVADDARSRALSVGGVAKHVAPTIKARRDRIPVVRMGGDQRLPPRDGRDRAGARADGVAGPRNPLNQTVGAVMWGAEFGGGKRPQSSQFNPYVPAPGGRGSVGYFLWPAVRADGDDIDDMYGDALQKAMESI